MDTNQKFLSEFDRRFNADVIEIDNHAWMIDEASKLGDMIDGWPEVGEINQELDYILTTKKISSVVPFNEITGVDWLADTETTSLFLEVLRVIKDRLTNV